MTNRELVAAAKAELEQTTVSGKNWVAGGRKPGHWKNAYAVLDQIADVPVTPDPSPTAPMPPAPPASYAIPAGARRVTTTAELVAALNSAGPIVLADGVYDGPARSISSDLYAEHLGKATLRFGIGVATPGRIVRGLVIAPAAQDALQGSCVRTWGSGVGLQVLDTVLVGGKQVAYGLAAYQPSGLVVERVEARDFTDVGLRLSTNQRDGSLIQRVVDVLIDGVTRAVPNSSNGTAEAGLWIGHRVIDGAHRIKVRNVSWSGIETVNDFHDTTVSDFDIDLSGIPSGVRVGVYMEHYTIDGVFEKFLIRGCDRGYNGEWNDPATGGIAACKRTTIRDGQIHGGRVGVYMDDGSDSTTVTGITFVGQTKCAIGAYRPVGTNVWNPNGYQLPAGVPQFRSTHISSW